ncbi:MAG: lytic transglycosylase domain-containing protein [Fervidobacterium sp.]|nr:lytic transglycosylase domain-containing protein [Fervidobacterium sp.]
MRYVVAFVLFGVIFFLTTLVYYFPLKYYEVVVRHSGKIDPLLIIGVIRTESSFKENAISNAGAYGLMQLMPETAEWLKKKFKVNYDYKTPEGNIALGCLYLNYLLEKDGNLKPALVHYNTGPYADEFTKVDAGGRYLRKVLTAYKIYKFLYRR